MLTRTHPACPGCTRPMRSGAHARGEACYRCRRKRVCKVCGDPSPGQTRRCAACRALRRRLAWLAEGAKRPPLEERASLVALYEARAALGLPLFP